jgi:hypothetical protein
VLKRGPNRRKRVAKLSFMETQGSRVDRLLGGPITVGGERYERGIGVHSRSNLVFELNGDYREFVTSYGMDDDSGPLADVTVMVLVDGQRRFEKTHVRRGTLFGPVRVDLSHAGRIELIVDYGDLQDRFSPSGIREAGGSGG